MLDLMEGLSRYREFAEEVAPPLSIDEVLEPARARSIRSGRLSGWPSLRVAAAATVMVLLLIGLPALLLTRSPDTPPVGTVQPSVPPVAQQPSTVTVPSSAPLPVVGEWFRVPHDEEVFGGGGWQSMESVVVGGPGLVAVGNDISEAAVWTSPDGVTWTRLPHEAGVFGGPGEQSMWSVTVGGPGLVAVGSDVANAESWDAAVWTSADGVSWTRVAHDEEVFGGGFMRSVTTGGPGLVAVGRATTFYDGGSESDAAVWTSRDGVSWTRVTHDEGVFGGGGNQGMRSVVVGGPGLVAVGSDNLMLGTGDLPVYPSAAVWTSPDGVNWTRVPHDENVFGGPGYQQMRSVVVGGPGLVAVGYDDGGTGLSHAAIWTSSDGLTWTREALDAAVLGGDGNVEMESVVLGGPGLVAVGYHWHLPGSDTDPVVWTSPDGATWTRVGPDDVVFGDAAQQQMASVVVGGPGLVAVGIGASDDDVDGAVWVWTSGQLP